MNLHRQSLVIEKRMLDKSLERLKAYHANDVVAGEESELLIRQRHVMKEYSYILGLRIEKFTNPEKP